MSPQAQPVEASANVGEHGRAVQPAGVFATVLLVCILTWWAWKEGAYFETVLLPGAIALSAGLAVLVIAVPLPRFRPAAAVAFAALLVLAAWSALSALWSPSPDIAIGDAHRIAVYALLFAAGLWAAELLGPRRTLSLAPLAVAGAAVGVLTGAQLALGDVPRDLLELDGTLDYPLGYRNAVAAFAGIALVASSALAADAHRDWRLRALSLAASTLCMALFILCQSRASVPAIAIGVAAYILLSPLPLRALGWLVLAALPAAGTIPAASELYRAVGDEPLRDAANEMNAAGIAVLVAGGVALLLGGLAARLGGRAPVLGTSSTRSNRAVAVGLGATILAAALAFTIAVGNPVEWVGDRLDEFRTQGTPDLSDEGSRFTFNAGSERYELWGIALDEGLDDPLRGTGGGGFHHAFLREREEEGRPAHDAHSIELEVFSELGVPGLALLVTALAGAGVGAVRSRGSSTAAGAVAAAALGVAAYWLVHSSIDWFWAYPAVSGPVFVVLGAACASPRVTASPAGRSRRGAAAVVVALCLFAITMVPPFLSKRYLDAAFDGWRIDLSRAYDDLDRARSLNPLSDDPWLAEGVIARASGDRDRALEALREAAATQPDEWATHYLIAQLAARSEPALAREEISIAVQQNPAADEVRALAERLANDRPRGAKPGG